MSVAQLEDICRAFNKSDFKSIAECFTFPAALFLKNRIVMLRSQRDVVRILLFYKAGLTLENCVDTEFQVQERTELASDQSKTDTVWTHYCARGFDHRSLQLSHYGAWTGQKTVTTMVEIQTQLDCERDARFDELLAS